MLCYTTVAGRYITLTTDNIFQIRQPTLDKSCGVCSSATTKTRQVIVDFDMISEIITFEQKGRFGKEKHQNLGVKVKVARDMVSGNT